MPFKPIGHGKFVSPSGRIFTRAQVVAYYATGGFKKKVKMTRKTHPRRMRAVRRRRKRATVGK